MESDRNIVLKLKFDLIFKRKEVFSCNMVYMMRYYVLILSVRTTNMG